MAPFVRERFPSRQAEVLDLYLRDPEFRGLCDDFGVSIEEIKRWAGSSVSEGVDQRIEDLQELRVELEADIAERLKSLEDSIPKTPALKKTPIGRATEIG